MMNQTQLASVPVRTTDRPRLFPTPDEVYRQHTADVPSVSAPTLEQIIAEQSHLPMQTAILGVCEDNLPVLFDMNDPVPGPLLVTGDSGCGKTTLLKSILKSSMLLNSPYEVQYSLISANPEEWMDFTSGQEGGHCFASASFYEDMASRIIIRMAEIAEQRRSGRELGAVHLLVIDDLRFMNKADFDVRVNFEWLLKHGPEQHIWPIVSLSTEAALEMSRLVSYYRTRLIGHMVNPQQKRLALFEGIDLENLQSGKQFAVRIQESWLSFALPSRI